MLQEAVRLQDLLETPLLAPEGRAWMQEYEQTSQPLEFDKWKESQDPSIKASQNVTKLENLLNPITNLKSMASLNKIWVEINSVRIFHYVPVPSFPSF